MEYYYKVPQNQFLHMKYRTINIESRTPFSDYRNRQMKTHKKNRKWSSVNMFSCKVSSEGHLFASGIFPLPLCHFCCLSLSADKTTVNCLLSRGSLPSANALIAFTAHEVLSMQEKLVWHFMQVYQAESLSFLRFAGSPLPKYPHDHSPTIQYLQGNLCLSGGEIKKETHTISQESVNQSY